VHVQRRRSHVLPVVADRRATRLPATPSRLASCSVRTTNPQPSDSLLDLRSMSRGAIGFWGMRFGQMLTASSATRSVGSTSSKIPKNIRARFAPQAPGVAHRDDLDHRDTSTCRDILDQSRRQGSEKSRAWMTCSGCTPPKTEIDQPRPTNGRKRHGRLREASWRTFSISRSVRHRVLGSAASPS